MFKYIKSFFTALNANAHPGDIAHAASLGVLLAFVPKGNLLWIFLFLLTIFIRVNKGAFFLVLILFSFIAPFFDFLFEPVGYLILSIGPLQGFYELMYQTPFIGLTRYNNTIVAGSLAAGIILYAPMYVLFRMLVVKYRNKLLPVIAKSKIMHVITNLPLIKQILNAPDIGGFNK